METVPAHAHKIDLDKYKIISRDEIVGEAPQAFAGYDADNDGKITAMEMEGLVASKRRGEHPIGRWPLGTRRQRFSDRFAKSHLHLLFDHCFVLADVLHELVVSPRLRNSAVFNHANDIGRGNCA